MKNLFFGKSFISGLISDKEKIDGVSSAIYTGKTFPSYGNFICGGPKGFYKLDIYSGEPFIDLDETHKLISFEVNSYSDDLSKSGFSIHHSSDGLLLTLGVCNVSTIALNNGIATWFRYYNSVNEIIIEGNVGKIGSDNELIVTDTLILQGEHYKSFGFKLLIPHNLNVF